MEWGRTLPKKRDCTGQTKQYWPTVDPKDGLTIDIQPEKESILGGEKETDNGMETEVMTGFSENDSASDFMMMEWKVGNKMSRLLNSLNSYRASLWSLDNY